MRLPWRKSALVAAAMLIGLRAAAPAQSFTATLTGAAEVPGPGDPDGSGTVFVSLEQSNAMAYVLLVGNIAAPTQAHVHRGSAAESGPIVVDLAPSWNVFFASGVASASPAILDEIRGNPTGFYVNVHNNAFPDGAVRGQLTPDPTIAGSALGLAGGRFVVTLTARDTLRTGNIGAGLALPENDLFGYFSIPALTSNPANPEVFVKLLDGRPVNGHWWVFYGHLTDLEYTVTVRDVTTGRVKTYAKAAVVARPGEGGFDTAAFPGP